MAPVEFELPQLRTLARHALPNLLEASVIPLVLFYVSMWMLGVWGALVVALIWSYGALLCRAATGRRIPGVLLIGTLALTARTGVALASGSVMIFFLQPTLGTLAVAGAFLISVPAGRPLAQRLAADFCPLPEHVLVRPHVRRFFARISVLWSFVHVANAVFTIWLLFSQPLGWYLLVKTVAGWTLTGGAVVLSVVSFRRMLARHSHLVPATVPS